MGTNWFILCSVSVVGTPAKSVAAELLPCTALSLTFFDRLYNNEVVRESGNIVKCFDDYYEDIVVSDELRKVTS
jgi:cilia- and flagella-associated protein 300